MGRPWVWMAVAFGVVFGATGIHAGGSAENAVLLIDPSDPISVYVGHHYRVARGIPDCNVIYVDPRAATYDEHVDFQQRAVQGTLAARGIDAFVDYIVIAPIDDFYVVEPAGRVTDGCFPVGRFSISSAYTFGLVSDQILAGGLPSTFRNHYFSAGSQAVAFDSQTHWSFGSPVPVESAPRYYLGALLGYHGSLGNTADELIEMIDRSVGADATSPVGTYYYMRTTDAARSLPRDPFFASAISIIGTVGGTGVLLDAVLPVGSTDCLG
ncbi:MAG: hypothetical protein KDC38_13855, partial [Planctomycetes bacterium]|nr:hypothetical protein [Planctomycetota bacterium]